MSEKAEWGLIDGSGWGREAAFWMGNGLFCASPSLYYALCLGLHDAQQVAAMAAGVLVYVGLFTVVGVRRGARTGGARPEVSGGSCAG